MTQQSAQQFMDNWNCPDCGSSGAIYYDGEEYPCLKCEQAAATYRKMRKAEADCDDIPEDGHKVGKVKDLYIAEKRMVMAVAPLTVSFDKTWHSCPDCDNAERGVCEKHDYLNTVHNASVYQGV